MNIVQPQIKSNRHSVARKGAKFLTFLSYIAILLVLHYTNWGVEG